MLKAKTALTLIFSFMRRLGLFSFLSFFFFWGGGGVTILNFNIFGGFQNNDFLGGMNILWIFFGDHHKIGLYLEVISMHFRVFSEGQGTEWKIFLGSAKISNIYLGCLKFLIFFFLMNGRCWVQAYV